MKLSANNYLTTDDEMHYSATGSIVEWLNHWDFTGYETKTYTHRIHNYPAVFIPQLARKLIMEFSKPGDVVLDIFNGSGTTTLETMLTDRIGYGIELNPLATLLAKVKTSPIQYEDLQNAFKIVQNNFEDNSFRYEIASYKNIEFWYDAISIKVISKLVAAISELKQSDLQDFLFITLSKILRQISLCNHSGFKMHRDKKKLNREALSSSQIWELFKKAFDENSIAMERLNTFLSQNKNKPINKPVIIRGSSMVTQKQLCQDTVDLIITSPPYGDSRTTVAYGQFSRLSSQWLKLDSDEAIVQLDKNLLGGKTIGVDLNDGILERSITLKSAVMAFHYLIESSTTDIERKKNILRLKDVISFYLDLDCTIKINSRSLKKNGHFILVTASRVVKGIKLNTDQIIAELSLSHQLEPKANMFRNIINKRMPRSVSATNVKGQIAPTMTTENILVLQKV